MSDSKSDSKIADAKEKAGKAGEAVKNIWLAGLGAYGKAIDEAQGTYQKVSDKVTDKVEQVKSASDNSKLFEELVEKGRKLEAETQEKFTQVKEKAHVSLEERLAKVKNSISFSLKGAASVNPSEELLSEILSKLDLVLEAVESKASVKAPIKKTAARSVSARKPA